MKFRKKAVSVICSFILVLGTMTFCSKPIKVEAETGNREINMGSSVLAANPNGWDNTSGQILYYGIYSQGDSSDNTPVPYRVLKNSAGKILLDSHTVLSHQFLQMGTPGDWLSSPSADWLDVTFYGSAFTDYEREAIMITYLDDATYAKSVYDAGLGGEDVFLFDDEYGNACIFSLTYDELEMYYKTTEVRSKSGAHYQLRSNVTYNSNQGVGTITSLGEFQFVSDGGILQYVRMSPAFYINTNKIAFTKTHSYNNGDFSKVETGSNNEWNAAIYDENTEFTAETTSEPYVTCEKGGNIELKITNTSNNYNQISAILADENGDVQYYGKIAEANATTASVSIPKNLEEGDYKLYVFMENITGDGENSRVSSMSEVQFTVEDVFSLSCNYNSYKGYSIENEATLVQKGVTAISNLVFVADSEHYFTEAFIEDIQFRSEENDIVNTNLTATRVSPSKIKISGTLNESVVITMPAAKVKLKINIALEPYETSYLNDGQSIVLKAKALDGNTNAAVSEGRIKYSSLNPEVAEIEASTGKIIIHSEGTAKFRATFSGSDTYFAGYADTSLITFTNPMPRLTDIPEIPYIIRGTKGAQGYYTSVVEIVAPEGYLISYSEDGEFASGISIDNSVDGFDIYLKEISSGLISNGISVEAIKIDTSKPLVSGASDNDVIYAGKTVITIADKDIEQIKVNGQIIPVRKGSTKITLSSNYGYEEYEIYVVDHAGNETLLKFTVADEWIRLGEIPDKQIVHLRTDKPYKFSKGSSWMTEGDSTEYAGGNEFYILTEGQYVFEKKTE